VEALEEIAQHARQVIWITPEPRWGWSLGSCDMPLYEKVCNRVEVVRDVEGLEVGDVVTVALQVGA